MSKDNDRHVVGLITKNARGEKIKISLGEYEGHKFLDIRQTFDKDGEDCPTKKGCALPLSKLDLMIDALLCARRKALELGWIRDDGARKAA
jgi:hypothetical protein